MLVSSLFHCFYLNFKYQKAKEKNITSLTINETEEIRKQKKRANKCVREGGEWEGREKRGKGREESGEGRGKWEQKEFDEKTNKQTNKQTNTCTKTQKDEWE